MNVLVVAGAEAAGAAVREMLARSPGSWSVEVVTSPEAGLGRLAAGGVDALVVDYRLSGRSGIDFIRDARGLRREIPVLLLSGGGRVDEVVVDRSALEAGAWHRLDRSELTPALLDRTLSYMAGRARDDRGRELEQVRFQARLLEAVGQAVIATELDGRVFYWNRAAEEMYGWTPLEALGQDVVELTAPAAGRAEAEQVMAALRRGESWSGELEARRKDGSTFRAYVTRSPVLGEGGALRGVIGVTSDITSIRATEGALTERVKELRTLYESGRILAEADRPLTARLQAVVDRIPHGWLYPEITEARLVLADRVLESAGFHESEWRLTASVDGGTGGMGRLDVVLTEPRPQRHEGPFLREERELLDSLARLIGETLRHDFISRTLRRTFAAVDEAVILTRDTVVEYANPAAERIFRCDAGELIGEDVASLLVDGRDALADSIPPLERDGVYYGDNRMLRRDGSAFHAEQTVSLVEPAQGLAGGAVAVIRDVTQRVVAEERIRKSEERFREIAEHSNTVFWISDPDLARVTYASPAFTDVFGRPVEALLDDPSVWTGAVLPSDRGRLEERLSAAPAEPFELEYRIVRPDGGVRWLLDRRFPVFENGAVARVIGHAEDVTGRKEAEERLSLLGREMAEGVQIIAPDGRIRFATPASQTLLGYRPEEVVGLDAFAFVHEEDRAELRELVGTVADRPGSVARAQYRGVRRDGGIRYLESVARNRIDHPAIGGLIVTTRDVTERRRLEEQLRQSQRLEAVGRLAGGIAHDFNNLLTVIRSETDLLALDHDSESLDPSVRDALDSIAATADRAAELTKQLLAFSREQVLQPRIVDLSSVVGDATRLLRRVIGEHVTLELDLARPLPSVRLDPGQLENVVVNLAVNARDAMPDGGTLRIVTFALPIDETDVDEHPGLEPGEYVVLEVTDSGEGMDAQTLSHLFEPFYTTKEKGRGTGLGLAMAYGFVKQSGGSVRVESEPGEGSTFRLLFPTVSGSPEEPIRADHRRGSPLKLADARVLVVEDNAAVRRVAVRVLERAGMDVIARSTAEEGLEELERGAFDLLITDLVLPGMSGRQLFEEVSGNGFELPVVVMSGYQEASGEEERELPDDIQFLEKPFTPVQLLGAVREALGPVDDT